MKLMIQMALLAVLFCGCRTPDRVDMEELCAFAATQDHAAMNEAFDALERYGAKHLKRGMTRADVETLLGEPVLRWNVDSKVESWPYVYSIGATWCYLVGFVDGRLEYWGRANPQWFMDVEYTLPGGALFLSAYRNEHGQQRETSSHRLQEPREKPRTLEP